MQNDFVLSPIPLDDLVSQLRIVIREEISSHTPAAPSTNGEGYLSRTETADMLKITLETLGQWTKTGRIKAYRIGRRVLYKRGEIDTSLALIKTGTKN